MTRFLSKFYDNDDLNWGVDSFFKGRDGSNHNEHLNKLL